MVVDLPSCRSILLALGAAGLLLTPPSAHADAPLTLAAAWTKALAQHPALVAAQAQVQAAQARVDVARLPYLPVASVDFSGAETTANYVAKPGALPKDLVRASAPTSLELWTFWQGGASAQWTLTDFGKTAAQVAAAQGLTDAARADATEVRRLLWQAFAASFAATWLADQRLHQAEANVALAEQRRALVHQLVERTIKPAADLALADSDVAMAQLAAEEQRSETQAARAGLAVWLGEPVAGDLAGIAGSAELAHDATASLDALLDQLAARDPLVQALEAQRRAVLAEVAAAERSLAPSLYVAGGVGLAGQQFTSMTFNTLVAAGIAWQGSAVWTAPALASQARAKLPVLAARQQEILRSKRLELAQARSRLQAALARRPLLAKAKLATEAAVQAAQLRYQSGVGLLAEVQSAHERLLKLQLRELAAEEERLVAELRWRAALGQID